MIGPDGKLIEPEPDTYATRDMVERIFHGESLSDGKQDILQTVFSLAAVLPSINNGLIPLKQLTVSGDGTAVKVHADLLAVTLNTSEACRKAHAPIISTITPIMMPAGDGTVMKSTGISDVSSTCLSAVIQSWPWNSPCYSISPVPNGMTASISSLPLMPLADREQAFPRKTSP